MILMSTDAKAYFKHGNYWLVYEKTDLFKLRVIMDPTLWSRVVRLVLKGWLSQDDSHLKQFYQICLEVNAFFKHGDHWLVYTEKIDLCKFRVTTNPTLRSII